jgi:glycosyltransferase involved in cell wall biosynthesis
MISVGLDLSALDPGFKSHAHRGIGRYVAELHTFFDSHNDPEVSVGFFDHEALRRNSLADKLVSMVPCGRTSLKQHVVYPRRLHQGVMRDFSLLHYPAHMDAPAWSSKPYVLTVLDLIPHVLKDLYRAHKPSWRFMVARSLEVLAIRQATLQLAISETTADDLVRLLGISRDRIVVTPLGVDERFFDVAHHRDQLGVSEGAAIRSKLGIPAGRPIVLYVGGGVSVVSELELSGVPGMSSRNGGMETGWLGSEGVEGLTLFIHKWSVRLGMEWGTRAFGSLIYWTEASMMRSRFALFLRFVSCLCVFQG